jgi:hypothetical protein
MGGRMPPTASRMASLPHTSAPGVTHIYPVTTRGLIAERGEPVTHTHTQQTKRDKKEKRKKNKRESRRGGQRQQGRQLYAI